MLLLTERIVMIVLHSESNRKRIFISYKRDVEPDEPVALRVFEDLKTHHEVFIDQHILTGMDWVKWIEERISESDFLIVFLTARSIESEMVVGEIRRAHELAKKHGSPRIIPVRLAYDGPLSYQLDAYLNRIQWAWWGCDSDTPGLMDNLRRAISGLELTNPPEEMLGSSVQTPELESIPVPLPTAQPQSVRLENPEGNIDLESKFYVERASDPVAISTIKRKGVTITIKGPRQVGKSSLLIRIKQAAKDEGKQIVLLDFQLFDRDTLADADKFFSQFCFWITNELIDEGLNLDEDQVNKYWDNPLGNPQRCTRYVGRYLLKEVGCPLVLLMDEVDAIFGSSFRTDFFSMLRSWHNKRASQSLWKQLDLALVTSTEPYQLIEDLNQSPFNVGEVIEMEDFTTEQVRDLILLHKLQLKGEESKNLFDLLAGHPYLTRKALYLIASGRMSLDNLFKQATDDRGPFGDHLRYHLFRLRGKQELIKSLREVIRHQTCRDSDMLFRLRGAGLVRKEGASVVPRCQLYARYFKESLNG